MIGIERWYSILTVKWKAPGLRGWLLPLPVPLEVMVTVFNLGGEGVF